MFQNITQTYTFADASMEIAIMLLWAFVLGFLLAWLIKPSKQYTKIITASKAKKPIKQQAVPKGVKAQKDDLQLIEGIGPKIEKHLQKHGIQNFTSLIQVDVEGLEDILAEWWSRLAMHSPTTWPDQARLANDGKWKELEEYQEILNAGRKK